MKSSAFVVGTAITLLAAGCAKFDAGASSQGKGDAVNGTKVSCGTGEYPKVVLCHMTCAKARERYLNPDLKCPFPKYDAMSWQEVYFSEKDFFATITGTKDTLCTMNPFMLDFNPHNVVGKVRAAAGSNRPLRVDKVKDPSDPAVELDRAEDDTCQTHPLGNYYTPGPINLTFQECIDAGYAAAQCGGSVAPPSPSPSTVPGMTSPVIVASPSAPPQGNVPASTSPTSAPPASMGAGGLAVPQSRGSVPANVVPPNPTAKYQAKATHATVIKVSSTQAKDLPDKDKCSVKKDESVALVSKSGVTSGHAIVTLAEKRCQFEAGTRVFLFIGHFDAATLPQ